MHPLVESFIIGIVTGLVTSTAVTLVFRSRDNKRDKIAYIQRIRRFAAEIYRVARGIKITANYKDVSDEVNMLQEIIESKPLYEKRFRLSKQERNIHKKYADKLSELENDVSEYRNTKEVLKLLTKMQEVEEKDIKQEEERQESAFWRISACSGRWLKLECEILELLKEV